MDITAANSSFTLSVPQVFATPQLLQGYATDEAFATTEVSVGEVMKGVDGRMSGAFIPFIVTQRIVFQADSPSISITMEAWIAAQQSALTLYYGNATILIPSVGRSYQLFNGALTRITPITEAKKILQPVTYEISWDQWQPMPIA